jgi:hypothetical protein
MSNATPRVRAQFKKGVVAFVMSKNADKTDCQMALLCPALMTPNAAAES